MRHATCGQKLFLPENSDFLIFTISVKLEDQKNSQNRHALTWPRIERGINENLTKLRKHKIFFVISTLILWLTHKQLSCFRHYFKGAINALKKLRKSWNRDGLYRLRFILPCKSDCQPIFLKKQGIYSFYAKLSHFIDKVSHFLINLRP